MIQGFVVQPHILAAIKARRKTQLRRPADQRCPFTPGRLYHARSVNAGWTAAELKDHRDWAIDEHPTRARAVLAYLDAPVDDAFTVPAALEVTVLQVHLGYLGQMDQHAAQREGWRFVDQFRNHWTSTYGPWDPDMPIWVITFAVGDLRDQFDRPRLLKATCGTISGDPDTTPEHQDYTDRPHLAMGGPADPGEGVDARTLERFAAEGAVQHAKRRENELRRKHVRTLTVRIRDAERREDWDEFQRLVGELGRMAA